MSELPESMRAAVLRRPQEIVLEDRPLPVLDDDQVLVRITAVGVCGSDAHLWHDGVLGSWTVTEPLVLGHESGGVVVAVGSAVDPARLGERVSIEPQRPHPLSRETLAGHYNLDPDMRFYAVPGTDGAFQEFAAIQSRFAWRVPDGMSDEAAALLEPLSVAIAAVRKAGLTVGDRVLVAGAGPVGVAVTQVARAYGAAEVVVSDVSRPRLEQAERFGAHRVLDPTETDPADLGLEADVFVDASGNEGAIGSGVRSVRAAGRVVLVGVSANEIRMPVGVLRDRELTLTGIFRYANTWPVAIGLAASGRVDLDSMVTGRFGLAETGRALASTTEPGTLKSVVIPTR